jgi:hypothetical protein
MMIERYEKLLDRRPLLVSSVLLRQNPNNVPEWIKRIKYIQEKKTAEVCKSIFDFLIPKFSQEVVEEFAKAIKTVEIAKVTTFIIFRQLI